MGYTIFDFSIVDPINDDRISFFDFSGDANDKVSSNDGVVEGATLTADRFLDDNSAYFFDGEDDFIIMGDVLDAGTEDFSILVYANVHEFKGLIPGTNTTGAYIFSKGITIFGTPRRAGYALLALRQNDDNILRFFVGSENDETFTADVGGLEPNRWYAIACVKSQNDIKVYIDGELKVTESIPSGINLDTNIPLAIGTINKLGADPAGTPFFLGDIDDLSFYQRALTAEVVDFLR